jgi:uncharacterized protein YbjQ (UPF0145 family)
MDTLMMIQILMMMFLVGMAAFFAGQIWESGREKREARKEAIRRLTDEILKETK